MELELWFFLMVVNIKGSGLMDRKMGEGNIKINNLSIIMKGNGKKERNKVMGIFIFKILAFSKVLFKIINVQVLELKSLSVVIHIKVSTKGESFMERVFMYGHQVPVLKDILLKELNRVKESGGLKLDSFL